MWTDEQLNAAKYVRFIELESQQDLGVGTVEIAGANNGIYLMRPVPPYGSLSNETTSVAGMKYGVSIPQNNLAAQWTPRGLPVPDRAPGDQYIVHDFGKPNL